MEIKHGRISADSHAAFDRDAFTARMSAGKWGTVSPISLLPAREHRVVG